MIQVAARTGFYLKSLDNASHIGDFFDFEILFRDTDKLVCVSIGAEEKQCSLRAFLSSC